MNLIFEKNLVPLRPRSLFYPSRNMSKALNPIEVGDLLKPLLLKDLRIAARSRGLNPGGNRETLMERLAEHIMETGDM
jgi:hypothetical protein